MPLQVFGLGASRFGGKSLLRRSTASLLHSDMYWPIAKLTGTIYEDDKVDSATYTAP